MAELFVAGYQLTDDGSDTVWMGITFHTHTTSVAVGETIDANQTLPMLSHSATVADVVTGVLSATLPSYADSGRASIPEPQTVDAAQVLPMLSHVATITAGNDPAFARMDWVGIGQVNLATTAARFSGTVQGSIAMDELVRALGSRPVGSVPAPGSAYGLYHVTSGQTGLYFSNGVDTYEITRWV